MTLTAAVHAYVESGCKELYLLHVHMYELL